MEKIAKKHINAVSEKQFVRKQAAAKKNGKNGSKPKSKKNGKTEEENSSFMMGFLWLLVFAFCLWLLSALFMDSGGFLSGKVSHFFKDNLGYSAYVFPFVLLYCLATVLVNIKKPHKGFLTMTAGLVLFMASLCGIIARFSVAFGNPKTGGATEGGQLGYLIDNSATHILGGFGSALVSIVMLFAGIHLLFRIPWFELISSFFNLIRLTPE